MKTAARFLALQFFVYLTFFVAGCSGGNGRLHNDGSVSVQNGSLSSTSSGQTRAAVTITKQQKGIQAVLLSGWSTESCDNFYRTCKSVDDLDTIAIGFEPYIKDGQATLGKFTRAKYIIGNLLDPKIGADPANTDSAEIDHSKKTVKVIAVVHLSFHSGSGGAESAQARDRTTNLSTRTNVCYSSFIKYYQGNDNVRIILTPSLEDEYTSKEFKTAILQMGTSLYKHLQFERGDKAHTFYLKGVEFERSVNLLADKDSVEFSPKGKIFLTDGTTMNVGKSDKFYIPVNLREIHGSTDNAQKEEVYSNDGAAVYYDNALNKKGVITETTDSVVPTNKQPTYSLTEFINNTTEVRSADSRVLLWRPSYNLIPRGRDNNFVNSNAAPRSKRTDPYDVANDGKPKLYCFDQTEVELLKEFLQ